METRLCVPTYLDGIVESVKGADVLVADLQVDRTLYGHCDAFVFGVHRRLDCYHARYRVLGLAQYGVNTIKRHLKTI
jgi:hypothetical protein